MIYCPNTHAVAFSKAFNGVFCELSIHFHVPNPTPTSTRATAAAGVQVVDSLWRSKGIDTRAVFQRDGSGLVRATAVLEILAGKGISWGILMITIGFLAPIALERYDLSQFKAVFTSPVGWIAILCGIAVAIMGGKGVITEIRVID